MQTRPEAMKLRTAVTDLSSRAELALSRWAPQLREQAQPAPGRTPNAAADRLVAEEKLRQQLAELEGEAAAVKREIDAKEGSLAGWEERAARAMQHSDDVTAREALAARLEHTEALEGLTGELALLQKLAASCRAALAAPR
jgi:hypothetical protein